MKLTVGKSFRAQSQHHTRLAKLHESQYKILSEKAATSTDALQKSVHEAQRDFHKAAQSEHEDEAERCEGCAISIEQGLEDAGGDSDSGIPTGSSELLDACLGSDERFRKLVPDRVRGVTPEVPAKVYAVPRHGAPPIETPASATLGGVDFLDLKALGED